MKRYRKFLTTTPRHAEAVEVSNFSGLAATVRAGPPTADPAQAGPDEGEPERIAAANALNPLTPPPTTGAEVSDAADAPIALLPHYDSNDIRQTVGASDAGGAPGCPDHGGATRPCQAAVYVLLALRERGTRLGLDNDGVLSYRGRDLPPPNDALSVAIEEHRDVVIRMLTFGPCGRCVYEDCYRPLAPGDKVACPVHRRQLDAVPGPWKQAEDGK